MGQKSSLLKWVALAVVLLSLFAAAQLFPVDQWLKAFNEWVSHLGLWGIVIFIGAYVLATVLLLPGSILTVGAGFVFGLGWGLFAVSIGIDPWRSARVSHSRFVAREKVEAMAKENENFRRIDQAIGAQGAKLILLLRLSPLIPFNLSNYFYGLTAVSSGPTCLRAGSACYRARCFTSILAPPGKRGSRLPLVPMQGAARWNGHFSV